jgi:ATP-binding cassette, subfamily B, bacterial
MSAADTMGGEVPTRFAGMSALQTLGRGVDAAPALRRGFGLTLLLAIIGTSGRLVVPIVVQQMIDRGIRQTDSGVEVRVDIIVKLVIAAFVVLIFTSLAARTAVARLGRQSEEAIFHLRKRLFRHIHRLSVADHGEERKGALVARVTSDVETLTEFFSWGALALLLNGIMMVLVAAVMLSYDWILAITAFLVSMPLAFVLRSVQRHLVAAYDNARSRNAEVMTSISELVAGAEVMRAYEAGESFGAQSKQASNRRSKAFIRAGSIGSFLFPSGELFSVLTLAAVVGVGVLRGPSSGLTDGAMVGFVFLTFRFLEPIAEITEVLDQTQTAVAGMRRVLGVLDIPIGPPEPASPVPLPAGQLGVSIQHVTFSYRSRASNDDEPPVLVDVTASIAPGEKVAVVGETGSGKTTLGRLVARFADPTSGVVRVGGVSLREAANSDIRRRLIMVPQEPFLFEGSIFENMAFAAPGLTEERLTAAIAELDLLDWLEGMSNGLATQVGQRGDQLSGGERQLVALIRASLVDPHVLVLDEATSSVDALTEVRIARALDRLAVGRTTIAIAHRLSTAARADRVLVLEHGRLVEVGPHAELVAANGPYTRMYEAWVAATSGT